VLADRRRGPYIADCLSDIGELPRHCADRPGDHEGLLARVIVKIAVNCVASRAVGGPIAIRHMTKPVAACPSFGGHHRRCSAAAHHCCAGLLSSL
jgi:hypothetical protein